jgi:aerobic carbon-monoxide dehydrogenase medium subunit
MINEFEYHAPKSVSEALALLDQYQDDCKIIAGGQSLLIMMRQGLIQPGHLIDIKGISELDYIRSDGRKGLKIGALTTHRRIEKSPVIKKSFSVLAEMENRLASIQTRNWGSIGGNLCHGDPASDPAPVLIALNATVSVAGPKGKRNMPLEDFFLDYFETALEHGELLTEIQVPAIAPAMGAAYAKFNVIETDMATVGVAVSITLSGKDGRCQDVRIVLGNAAPKPLRPEKAEAHLRGKKISERLLKEAGEIASTEADPISDIHASAEYRRELLKVMVQRVGSDACSRAQKS